MSTRHPSWIRPDWPAPAQVRAFATTRLGGVSEPPYASFNLGDHVGDNPDHVARNRRRLRELLQLPAEPCWLNQVHGRDVVEAGNGAAFQADGAWTAARGTVCAVLTADCLPVLLCDRQGRRVAALHAGWRGLAAGVLEAGVEALGCRGGEVMAWLGPAIGPQAFEVGEEVRTVMVDHDTRAAAAFTANRSGHWLADLYALARQRLEASGVEAVYGGDRCTHSERDHFFSYRREGVTGRSASLIWLA